MVLVSIQGASIGRPSKFADIAPTAIASRVRLPMLTTGFNNSVQYLGYARQRVLRNIAWRAFHCVEIAIFTSRHACGGSVHVKVKFDISALIRIPISGGMVWVPSIAHADLSAIARVVQFPSIEASRWTLMCLYTNSFSGVHYLHDVAATNWANKIDVDVLTMRGGCVSTSTHPS